jgi:hypothetical protein
MEIREHKTGLLNDFGLSCGFVDCVGMVSMYKDSGKIVVNSTSLLYYDNINAAHDSFINEVKKYYNNQLKPARTVYP